ncbi:MAG: di-trans,poly-cis-decaprenylcistransferase [Clostridiales bacterium]|jgi:undecaprenyl diphosphate synthase|nr:di-trans,poly-cis-decaprenylcistransferase [Clostridiales bacterium]
MNIPNHIGIIMDGNGRYARMRGLPRSAGHGIGVKALRRTVTACYELGVKTLTLYAFSTENRKRPKEEVAQIMRLLLKFLRNYKDELKGRDIRIEPMGDITALPASIQAEISHVSGATAHNNRLIVYVALNYGGRAEIARAARNIAQAAVDGELAPADVDERLFSQFLYGDENRDVDLIIRTSGELRLSNFLLWQGAYSEFWVTKKKFPEFNKRLLKKAIKAYNKRDRRKGGLNAE